MTSLEISVGRRRLLLSPYSQRPECKNLSLTHLLDGVTSMEQIMSSLPGLRKRSEAFLLRHCPLEKKLFFGMEVVGPVTIIPPAIEADMKDLTLTDKMGETVESEEIVDSPDYFAKDYFMKRVEEYPDDIHEMSVEQKKVEQKKVEQKSLNSFEIRYRRLKLA